MKYIVKLIEGFTREDILHLCTKVGKPKSCHTLLIVETDDKEKLEKHHSVKWVTEADSVVDPSNEVDSASINVRPHNDSWHLPNLSQHPTHYISSRNGEGVSVYVLDSGANIGHFEFDGRAEVIYSFDGNDYSSTGTAPHHGTLAGSLAVGRTVGVANKAKNYHARFNWTEGSAIMAMDRIISHYNANNAPAVLSLSLTSTNPMFLHAACNLAREAGMVVVAAAGNNSEPAPRAPANHSEIISVGASDRNGNPAHYTNYGNQIDVFGWGHNVRSATLTNYTVNGGTSSATPIIAGVIAQLLQGSDKLPNEQEVARVKQWLKTNSRVGVNINGVYAQTGTTNKVPTLNFSNVPFYRKPIDELRVEIISVYAEYGRVPDAEGLEWWTIQIHNRQATFADLRYALWLHQQSSPTQTKEQKELKPKGLFSRLFSIFK